MAGLCGLWRTGIERRPCFRSIGKEEKKRKHPEQSGSQGWDVSSSSFPKFSLHTALDN